MRIGIFGGTFDPVHYGHLIIAEQAREQAGLDRVRFLPSARPPHKVGKEISPFERRVEMLNLALAGQENRFEVDLLERDRPGPSFTADTLDELAANEPQHDWFLILGGDCLPDFAGWHEPLRIIDRATLLVAGRPGFDVWSGARLAESLKVPADRVKLRKIDVPLIEIASRDLRQRAEEGRSLLYFLPRAVEVLIREKRVYA
jgi:nicotinate-nucleotide adenylyltransferase